MDLILELSLPLMSADVFLCRYICQYYSLNRRQKLKLLQPLFSFLLFKTVHYIFLTFFKPISMALKLVAIDIVGLLSLPEEVSFLLACSFILASYFLWLNYLPEGHRSVALFSDLYCGWGWQSLFISEKFVYKNRKGKKRKVVLISHFIRKFCRLMLHFVRPFIVATSKCLIPLTLFNYFKLFLFVNVSFSPASRHSPFDGVLRTAGDHRSVSIFCLLAFVDRHFGAAEHRHQLFYPVRLYLLDHPYWTAQSGRLADGVRVTGSVEPVAEPNKS